jgi:hypothetical protein
MSIKSTTIAARVELLTAGSAPGIRSHVEEQYEEVLIPRETLRLANDNARKLRPVGAKDAAGSLALP